MKTLSGHFEDLKQTALYTFSLIALSSLLAFAYYDSLIKCLTAQLATEQKLILFSPMDGFIIAFQVAVYGGAIFSLPLWIIPIGKFLYPALLEREKETLIPFIFVSFIFIVLGGALGYYITLPVTNQYLWNFNETLGMNFWGLKNYIDYALTLILAHAAGMEIFALLLLMVHYRWISYKFLKGKRKHALVLSLIIGAFLTPPDVFSQLLLAIPLYLLFELIVIYAWIKRRLPISL